MIDYRSTDRSCDIIRDLCPQWEIRETRNKYFDSQIIDDEVVFYERMIAGWRMALNVTEFLVGNFGQLNQFSGPTQHFIGNIVFVHPETDIYPSPDLPLYDQVQFGYIEDNPNAIRILDTGARASRSIHNFDLVYPMAGRHWPQTPTLNDLVIFYYGYTYRNEAIISRKLQIKQNISPEEAQKVGGNHPNTVTRDRFLSNIETYHLPRCRDLSGVVENLTRFHRSPNRVS
ncbi:hypothetical protein SAMN05216360_12053 [Methylobacterium phyllostachyos]|uniref:Uncharacterized protein n=2 Tax=Methylobacterium phyllostachyos TaxID=582672 RepID=A0A1H0IW64_9HYPH|nr:hypothetical protein SAMN05216360_12053 [Methylobacterium phyllostachyos]